MPRSNRDLLLAAAIALPTLSTVLAQAQVDGARPPPASPSSSVSASADAVGTGSRAAPTVSPSASSAGASAPAASSCAPPKPLDLREPPFDGKDFSWLNGNNRQPDPLLRVGPVVLSLYVDAFYAWQFSRPNDHTIFPTTTAPRHNELGFNLASIGMELPPNAIDSAGGGPIGQFSLQYGAITQTVGGQDPTVNRGFFLTGTALQPIRTASAGWHFHAMQGLNLEFGIFPSYVAMESYLPQENWNYSHPFVSDFTPYYFYGGRAQLYPAQDWKIELWVVNGWQTFGQWHEGRAGGYLINWRPTERFIVAHVLYVGQEQQADPGAVRYYTDNYAQLQYWKNKDSFLQSSAIALVADVGYEARTTSPAGPMTGYSITNRMDFRGGVSLTLRGDVYYDKTRALTTMLPLTADGKSTGAQMPNGNDPFLGGGFTATLDYLPSPWLLWRLEYAHRAANVPFFSGSQGVSPPSGLPTGASYTPALAKTDDRIIANVTLRL
jgi:hypothetical protein